MRVSLLNFIQGSHGNSSLIKLSNSAHSLTQAHRVKHKAHTLQTGRVAHIPPCLRDPHQDIGSGPPQVWPAMFPLLRLDTFIFSRIHIFFQFCDGEVHRECLLPVLMTRQSNTSLALNSCQSAFFMPADLMIAPGNAALSPLFAWMEALNSPVMQFTATH